MFHHRCCCSHKDLKKSLKIEKQFWKKPKPKQTLNRKQKKRQGSNLRLLLLGKDLEWSLGSFTRNRFLSRFWYFDQGLTYKSIKNSSITLKLLETFQNREDCLSYCILLYGDFIQPWGAVQEFIFAHSSKASPLQVLWREPVVST